MKSFLNLIVSAGAHLVEDDACILPLKVFHLVGCHGALRYVLLVREHKDAWLLDVCVLFDLFEPVLGCVEGLRPILVAHDDETLSTPPLNSDEAAKLT